MQLTQVRQRVRLGQQTVWVGTIFIAFAKIVSGRCNDLVMVVEQPLPRRETTVDVERSELSDDVRQRRSGLRDGMRDRDRPPAGISIRIAEHREQMRPDAIG